MFVHSFGKATDLSHFLDVTGSLQTLHVYTVTRKLSMKAQKQGSLEEPLHNLSFLFLVASTTYSSSWFVAGKGNLLEKTSFSCKIPRSLQIFNITVKGKGDPKFCLSPDFWVKIMDGLGIGPKDLVLDLNPRYGIFYYSSIFFYFLFFSLECFMSFHS